MKKIYPFSKLPFYYFHFLPEFINWSVKVENAISFDLQNQTS